MIMVCALFIGQFYRKRSDLNGAECCRQRAEEAAVPYLL
jgi:hypothetical protein